MDNTNQTEMEITKDETFNYNGYQVVRGEFFAHLFEPSVTLCDEKVAVNAACIRKLPDTDFVQFLVNPTERKLAVRPCSEDTKDSFRWSSTSQNGKKKPKSISCKIFFSKVMDLMNWNPQYRYKIIGKLIRAANDMCFVFDLTCAETFTRSRDSDGNVSRSPFFPTEWKEQFGVPVSEHQDSVLISIFDDYTVFRIEKDEGENANDTNDNTGHEEEQNSYPQNYPATSDESEVHSYSYQSGEEHSGNMSFSS